MTDYEAKTKQVKQEMALEITKQQLGQVLEILEDLEEMLNEDDLKLYEQLLTKYQNNDSNKR